MNASSDQQGSDERRCDRFVELANREVGHLTRDQLDRGWLRIQDPLARGATTRARAPERGLKVRVWLAGFVTASAVAALALVAYRTLPDHPEPPLHFAIEGSAASQGNTIATPSGTSSRLLFSDESHIDLDPATKMTVHGLDARGAQIGLADGALDVYVKPRAHASWRFVAGPFQVNVKGTEFHLAFAADRGRLTLHMKSGSVEVLAPHNRTLAVGKDESLELFAEPAIAERPTPAPPAAIPVEEGAPAVGVKAPSASLHGSGSAERHRPASPASDPSVPSVSRPVAWSKLLAKGDFASVIADAERRGVGPTIAQANAADLSALADAARYTKRNELARQVLLAMRARFAGSEPARDASFFLGRLAESASDRSKSAEPALTWYETYLREASHGLYASEALGREMALLAHGTPTRARKVARQYLASFPQGPQAELARALLEAE